MSARRVYFAAVVAALAAATALLSADSTDEIAFRRVVLRADQLAAELEKVRLGVWRQMPVDQFDDLARRAAAPPAERPQLLETRYRGRLDGESLVGSGSWTVRHSGRGPALLAVDPLQIAVRRAAWPDNRPAVMAELDSRAQSAGLELLVDHPGDRVLALDWSARGLPEPAGTRFDLRLPACPLAVMDLELPADVEPSVSREGVVLTGPLPAEDASMRAWRLAFGLLSQLDLTIRPRAPAGDAAPLVLVRQRNRQELTPGIVQCEYAIEFEAARAPVRELIIDCDPGLRVTDVTARNLRGWEVVAGPAPGSTRAIAALAEPTTGGVVTVRAATAVPPDEPWASPAVRVVGALARGETLSMRVHPDVRLHDWRAGGYRLADSAVGDDRWHVLTLQPSTTKPDPIRPAARLRVGGPEYAVRERLWWRVAADRSTLTAEVAVAVSRGPVGRVPLSLPVGWNVERVEFEPQDAGTSWEVGSDRSVLTLTWPRSLGAGDASTATVQLARRGGGPGNTVGDRGAFPDLFPTGARSREGILALRIEPDLETTLREPPGLNHVAAESTKDAPWGPTATTAVYPLTRLPVEGVLQVTPVRPRYRATATTRAVLAGRAVHLTHELRVEPSEGAPDSIVLYVPSWGQESWNWQVASGPNRVRSTTRLGNGPPPASWLAAASALDVVALAGARDPAGWWRVAFERPLSGPVELRATLDLVLPADAEGRVASALAPLATGGGLPALVTAASGAGSSGLRTLPLVRAAGAEREEHTVDLTLRTPGWDVAAAGLSEVPTPDSSAGRRTFRGDGSSASLVLQRSKPALVPVDAARLVSSLPDGGGSDHVLAFRLWNWPAADVTVGLPFGAVVRSARVDGREVRPELGPDARLRLPVPFGRRVGNVEVRFSTRMAPWTFWARLRTPSVELPVGSGPVEYSWQLPEGVVSLFDGGAAENVVAVRPRSWSVAGLALAVVWFLTVRGLSKRWPLAVALAVAAVALVALPVAVRDVARWPLYALALAAIVSALPRRAAASTPFAAAALAAWLGTTGRASAPGVPTVYLVPGPLDDPQPRTVLAPPDLIGRLTARARSHAPPDFAVPVEAAYEGRVAGTSAFLKATLAVETNADGPTALSLPLGGALLREAKLDGAAAFPKAAGDRVVMSIAGRGRHRVELDFVVPCPAEDDRELRLPVAEAPVCSLSLRLPNAARFVQTTVRRGGLRLTDEDGERRLDVDLGRVGSVAVRWRQEGPGAAARSVAVRESYLWNLHPTAAKLLGALRYSVAGGTASLAVDIPPGLVVTAASARPLDAAGPTGSLAWLRRWHVVKTDGGRRLLIDFSAPIAGNWLVALELVPVQPLGASFGLTFPSAAGATQAAPAVVAWRAHDFNPQVARLQGWTEIRPEDFLNDHWVGTRVEPDPRAPTRAYRRSLPDMSVLMRLSVRTEETPRADVTASWAVGPRRAVFAWVARLRSFGTKVSLVECDVPAAVEVFDASGSDVYSWSRTGTRVQVWLRHAVESAEVTLRGAVPRRVEGAGRFDVPNVRLANAVASGTLGVVADDGWSLTPVAAQQLEAVPDTGRGGREWRYRFASPAIRAAFQVRAANGATDFRVATRLDRYEERPRLVGVVTARVRRGNLRSVILTGTRAEGWEVSVDAPRAEQVRELPPTERRRAWVIDLPAGVTGEYRLAITARAPSPASGEWSAPDFSVRVFDRQANRVERFVTLGAPDLRVVKSDGFAALPSGEWQAVALDPTFVVAAATDPPAAGVGVLAEDFALARAGDGSWLGRATWRVRPETTDVLRLTWPHPVRLNSAVRDGLVLAVPPGPTREFLVRLGPYGGESAIGLTWTAADRTVRPDAVGGPRLSTSAGAVVARRRTATVVAPPGWSVNAPADPVTEGESTGPAQPTPFDGLFDDARKAARFRVRGPWPLALAWSPPESRWPATVARLLGVAMFFGMACAIAWKVNGPRWPFMLILLGAGLAVVDNAWLGALPAIAGIVGGTAQSFLGRPQREVPQGELSADGHDGGGI